ncbi:MAG TPA: PAS domain S-box protein [Vicinamibacterales bacterium]|jgi:PAS domain S-box-containing protein
MILILEDMLSRPPDTGAQDDEPLQAQLAAIVDSSDDAIVGKTLDGVITSWNRAAERLFGYSAGEAIGQHIFLIIPDDRHAEEDFVLSRFRLGEKIEHFETVRRAKDGRLIPVSLTVSPIRDPTGRIVGASKVARDITESQQNDRLRARLGAIVDSSDDAIVSKTLDGVITSWNRAAERLFGYSAAEAIGQNIVLIIPEDRRGEEEDVLARLRRGEKVDHFETIRRTKDGRHIPISLTVSPVKDVKGRIIGASKVARDISERVLAQEALRRAHDQLDERVRERTAELSAANLLLSREIERRQRVEDQRAQLFTRLVLAQEDERRRIALELHDQLGQQMTALRLTLEALKALAAERSELRQHVEVLEDLTRRIDQDLSFRVWELAPAALQGAGLAAALTDYAASWSKRFGIRAQVHVNGSIDGVLLPEMETTIYRFGQEALNNIAKHARADRVDIALERRDEQVSFIVEDNGVGFVPAEVKTGRGGFGLRGMRERAALAGAECQIESAPGSGTTIILRVPITAATTIKSA